ncbi:hypothetical protein MMC07_007677 [Pseudocyphellaria aurata]|nr:hypothetical protein [Pseudocyphellaria aurata]
MQSSIKTRGDNPTAEVSIDKGNFPAFLDEDIFNGFNQITDQASSPWENILEPVEQKTKVIEDIPTLKAIGGACYTMQSSNKTRGDNPTAEVSIDKGNFPAFWTGISTTP